jgi:Glycosyl hydrolase family 3 C-terminal domain
MFLYFVQKYKNSCTFKEQEFCMDCFSKSTCCPKSFAPSPQSYKPIREKGHCTLLDLCKTKPTIFIINLDRPAVFPEINAAAKGVFGEFGASDGAVLDVIFGKAKPGGKLPFELPSSMQAVREQKEDVPYDSKEPLYKFGFGLSYE